MNSCYFYLGNKSSRCFSDEGNRKLRFASNKLTNDELFCVATNCLRKQIPLQFFLFLLTKKKKGGFKFNFRPTNIKMFFNIVNK